VDFPLQVHQESIADGCSKPGRRIRVLVLRVKLLEANLAEEAAESFMLQENMQLISHRCGPGTINAR
jgi:hypothetical protein